MEGTQQTSRVEEKRPIGEGQVALTDRAEVFSGDVGLTNSPGRQVQDAIAVVLDLGKQLGDARLGPILANDGQDVSQHVRPGDENNL